MSSKRYKTVVSRSDNRFLDREHEGFYQKLLHEKITESKILDQSRLRYPVSNLFVHSTLSFLLALTFPFHRDLIYEFYANLMITTDHRTFTSRVNRRDVTFTKDDLHEFLQISITGPSPNNEALDPDFDWLSLNQLLREKSMRKHYSVVDGLTVSARVVQHVLRNSIVPKAGDRTAISPVQSITTYFIVKGVQFDVGDLIIRHLENLLVVRLPLTRRKQNLVLGHVIAYLLNCKYNITSQQEPDVQPQYYTDNSFHSFFGPSKERKRPPVDDSEEEAGEEEGEAAAPGPATEDVPRHQGESSSHFVPHRQSDFDFWGFRDYVEERFDRIDTKIDSLTEMMKGHFTGYPPPPPPGSPGSPGSYF